MGAGTSPRACAQQANCRVEQQIAESSNSTDEAKTDNKLNRTNRLGNLFRNIKLWMRTHRIRHLAGIITHDEHGNQTTLSGNKKHDALAAHWSKVFNEVIDKTHAINFADCLQMVFQGH